MFGRNRGQYGARPNQRAPEAALRFCTRPSRGARTSWAELCASLTLICWSLARDSASLAPASATLISVCS
jgi:hypothetical protein